MGHKHKTIIGESKGYEPPVECRKSSSHLVCLYGRHISTVRSLVCFSELQLMHTGRASCDAEVNPLCMVSSTSHITLWTIVVKLDGCAFKWWKHKVLKTTTLPLIPLCRTGYFWIATFPSFCEISFFFKYANTLFFSRLSYQSTENMVLHLAFPFSRI